MAMVSWTIIIENTNVNLLSFILAKQLTDISEPKLKLWSGETSPFSPLLSKHSISICAQQSETGYQGLPLGLLKYNNNNNTNLSKVP